MKTLWKIETEFWEKKINEYEANLQSREDDKNATFIPIDCNLNATLERKINRTVTISVVIKHEYFENHFYFFFRLTNGKIEYKYCYQGSREKTTALFNQVFRKYNHDNEELQELLEVVRKKVEKKALAQNNIDAFVNDMMNNSVYEWRLIEKGQYSVLQIKLTPARIIEIVFGHRAMKSKFAQCVPKNILNATEQIEKQLAIIPFPVNIINCISEKWGKH